MSRRDGIESSVSVPTHKRAAVQLARMDRHLAELVRLAGPPTLRPPLESHFAALVRSILYQQLAGGAASAIHARLVGALDSKVTPEALVEMDPGELRAVGLSQSKIASLRDLSSKVIDGSVDLEPGRLSAESDEEIVARLSTVRGIGRWTAEMFLMFQLRRLDVWPAGDLGVRRGYGLAWDVPMPSSRELEPLGEPYRPYRSVVAWYCWRACELYARAGKSALTT
ncbi:MAG: DNA-3-methyladenine glycosylase 2 family protein [Actinobacteria bacterium]|nr:DNA-3-methyladenine glycosylase 2 family protein [Actinomycetota bacterium]